MDDHLLAVLVRRNANVLAAHLRVDVCRDIFDSAHSCFELQAPGHDPSVPLFVADTAIGAVHNVALLGARE